MFLNPNEEKEILKYIHNEIHIIEIYPKIKLNYNLNVIGYPLSLSNKGYITNNEENRLKSGVKQVYDDSFVSLIEYGDEILIKKGDVFYMPEYAFTAAIETAETYTGVNNKGILFEIELPKGTKTNMDSSYHILPRASKFECLSNEETDEYYLIKIKLIDKIFLK